MSQTVIENQDVLPVAVVPASLPILLSSPMTTYSAVRNPAGTIKDVGTRIQVAMVCTAPSAALSTLFGDFQLTGSLFAMNSELSQKEKIEYIELIANIIMGLLEMGSHYFISRSRADIEKTYKFIKNLLSYPLEADLIKKIRSAVPVFLNNYGIFLLETGSYDEGFQVLDEAAHHSKSTLQSGQYYFDAEYAALKNLDGYFRTQAVQDLDQESFQPLQERSRELLAFAEDMWNIYYNQANRTISAQSLSQQDVSNREAFERGQKSRHQALLAGLYVDFLGVKNGFISSGDISAKIDSFELLKRRYVVSFVGDQESSLIEGIDYKRTFDQGDGNLIAQIELLIQSIGETGADNRNSHLLKYTQSSFWAIGQTVARADEQTILGQVTLRGLEGISLHMRGLSLLRLQDKDDTDAARITQTRDKYFYAIASEIIRQSPVGAKMRVIIEGFLKGEVTTSKGIAQIDRDSIIISVKSSGGISAGEHLEDILLRNKAKLIEDAYSSIFGVRQWRLVLKSDHENIISSSTKYPHGSADSTTSGNARFAEIAGPHDTLFFIELLGVEESIPPEIVHIVIHTGSQKWIHGLLKEPVKDAVIISLRMKNYLLGLRNAELEARLANDPLEKVRGLIVALNNSLLPYHNLQNIPGDEALRIANSTNNFLMNIVAELLRNSDKPQGNIVQLRYISDLVSSSIVGLGKIFTDDKISPATVSSPAYQKVTDALMKLGVALAQIQIILNR